MQILTNTHNRMYIKRTESFSIFIVCPWRRVARDHWTLKDEQQKTVRPTLNQQNIWKEMHKRLVASQHAAISPEKQLIHK